MTNYEWDRQQARQRRVNLLQQATRERSWREADGRSDQADADPLTAERPLSFWKQFKARLLGRARQDSPTPSQAEPEQESPVRPA